MRWKLLLATATALAGLAPIGVAQATAGGAGLAWDACPSPEIEMVPDPRLRCATLHVPLDYRRPHGRQITITISRIPATNPQLRRGILLANPGGPGIPGLIAYPTRLAARLPADVLDRYDLIGFDPRGIGRSTPVSCGLTVAGNETLILPYPAPDGSIARNVTFARATAASCAAHSGDLLPYITTANTARDMDRIRAALGEPKLSYFGFSYSTYLAQVYASLFTARTDRVILDSAVDPTHVWAGFWPTLSAATDLRMPDFTRWAARRDGTYHLGNTPAKVRHTFDRVAAMLDRTPVFLAELGRTVDGNLLRELTRDSLYYNLNFPRLAQIWQLLAQPAAPASTVGPSALSDLLPGAAPVAPDVPADNQAAALYAIVCDDARWPLGPAEQARAVAADRRAYPITAGMPANIWPCAFWPHDPVEPPVTITRTGPRNILILQNLRDPATSWVSGRAARNALAPRAVMVSIDAGGHGVYPGLTGGPCADAIATAFLAFGTLPAADRWCTGPTPDDVTGPIDGNKYNVTSVSSGRAFNLHLHRA